MVTDIGGGFVRADLYVDGVLEGSDTGNQIDRSGWDTDLRIGSPGAATRFFSGTIDAVQIYDQAFKCCRSNRSVAAGRTCQRQRCGQHHAGCRAGNGPHLNGTVSFNPDGSFSYTPNADFTGDRHLYLQGK